MEKKAPYYAVIFSSNLKENADGYAEMASQMNQLAEKQAGFLGLDTARSADSHGITVSYWDSLQAIQDWRNNIEHQKAIQKGMTHWYKDYQVKITRVERAYEFSMDEEHK